MAVEILQFSGIHFTDGAGAYGVILGDPDELATHIVEFGYTDRLVSSDDCEGEEDDGAH